MLQLKPKVIRLDGKKKSKYMWFARDTSKQNDIEMLRVKRNKYTKCNQDKVAISILILKEVDLINIKLSLLHLILI